MPARTGPAHPRRVGGLVCQTPPHVASPFTAAEHDAVELLTHYVRDALLLKASGKDAYTYHQCAHALLWDPIHRALASRACASMVCDNSQFWHVKFLAVRCAMSGYGIRPFILRRAHLSNDCCFTKQSLCCRRVVQQASTLAARVAGGTDQLAPQQLVNLLRALTGCLSLLRQRVHDDLIAQALGVSLWSAAQVLPMSQGAVISRRTYHRTSMAYYHAMALNVDTAAGG